MRLVMTVVALLSTQILFGQGNTIHGLGAGNAGIANTSVGEYAGDVVSINGFQILKQNAAWYGRT